MEEDVVISSILLRNRVLETSNLFYIIFNLILKMNVKYDFAAQRDIFLSISPWNFRKWTAILTTAVEFGYSLSFEITLIVCEKFTELWLKCSDFFTLWNFKLVVSKWPTIFPITKDLSDSRTFRHVVLHIKVGEWLKPVGCGQLNNRNQSDSIKLNFHLMNVIKII